MGQVLGRYHIISELGRGGMGVVYKALDPKLERFIAIKCLSEKLSNDEIVVARFLREARNVAALNHPNIAQVFVADEHEGMPYFVMEYVDGESLAEFIDREGQCTPEMARRVAEQAAEALAAAAEENIAHRDIKPANIMLDRRGRAVLTDFGIARVVADQSGATRTDTLMGTPGYLPPEALTGQQADGRGDIFALGLVYYEMLTGRRLIENTDIKAMMGQFMRGSDPELFTSGQFPDLSALEGRFDQRVVDIIQRMLAVDPEKRYPDCRSLLDDMAPLKTGATGPVKRPDSGPSAAEIEATKAVARGNTAKTRAQTRQVSATEETERFEDEPAPHPETVPVAQSSTSGRAKRFGLVAALVVSLAMIALGIARMDESHWDRVTGLFPGEDEALADAGEGSDPADQVATVEMGEATEVELASADEMPATGEPEESVMAGQNRIMDESGEAASDADDPRLAGGEVSDVSPEAEGAAPAAGSEQLVGAAQPEQPPADSATSESAPAVPSVSSAPADEPGREVAMIRPAEPEPAPPAGVAVIGVGDPVITDPMVREIEQTLRGAGTTLVDERFIGNYRQFVHAEDIDLAGLARPALDAGARYVVVARAVPAGTRELQFYNRFETAYIVQLETVTFDLHERQQVGSSPMKQIEYTSLNATERARESVRPWLPGLRDQFGR